jgi:hypothetical protein
MTKRDLPLPRCFFFFVFFFYFRATFKSFDLPQQSKVSFCFIAKILFAGFLPRASETGDWKIEASMPTHPHIIFECKESNQAPRLVRGKSENNKTK